MPPCDDHYLLGYLWELDPPFTHREILAWVELTGIVPQPWEARFLRALSREYVAEARRATKRDCQAPWQSEGSKPQVTSTQAKLRALAQL